MSEQDFRAFIEKQHPPVKSEKVDWKKELREWQEFLTAFYAKVEEFLNEYKSSGKVILRKEKLQLSEENIGTYFVVQLVLELASCQVKLTPIGTLLIGAKGRVDMSGPKGTIRFVLVDSASSGPRVQVSSSVGNNPPAKKEPTDSSPIEWAWRISAPPPNIKYLSLTKDSFFDALLKVIND